MAAPSYPLLTDRLVVRPIDPARDVDGMHSYRSLPDACRFVPFPPCTRDQIAERLADPKYLRSTFEEEGDVVSLAVELRTTGEMVGDLVLFWHSAQDRAGEIGYILHPDHHGLGYATEACRALLDLAFLDFGMHRVTAEVDVRNDPSASVALRLGMREEGTHRDVSWQKGEWVSFRTFAVLEDEWTPTVRG